MRVPLMPRLLPAVLLAACGCRSSIPEVPFSKASRETIVSTVQTNGIIEPVEFSAIRAEREGAVDRIHAAKGEQFHRAALLLELNADDDRAALAAAEAHIAEATADLATLRKGGRASDLVSIANDLETAQLDLETAQEGLATLERLAARQAATRYEVDQAAKRVQEFKIRIESLRRKRDALVSPADLREAESRLSDAKADAETARRRIALARIKAPMAGLLYRFDVKPGAYLKAGDLVGEIGQTGRVRAIIYVDEPELGRVAAGMPVDITWDALPGRRWTGTLQQVPAQVRSLGTRQVGEVLSVIDNPDNLLPPGANINAEIRSSVSENAITIPKEALLRRGGSTGVYLLTGETVDWRPVQIGTSSITRVEILHGLAEGDAVALPTETELFEGARVKALFR